MATFMSFTAFFSAHICRNVICKYPSKHGTHLGFNTFKILKHQKVLISADTFLLRKTCLTQKEIMLKNYLKISQLRILNALNPK